MNLDGITGLRIGDGSQDINIHGGSLDDPTTAGIRIDVGMGVDCRGHEIIIEHPGGEIVLDQRLQILPGGLDVDEVLPDSGEQDSAGLNEN